MAERTQGAPALRALLAGGEPVLAPGAYDGLSARLAEQAGFGAVYMTGFGASASLLGRPDIGLLSFAEMADHARRLVQAVGIPVPPGAPVRAVGSRSSRTPTTATGARSTSCAACASTRRPGWPHCTSRT